MRINQRKNRAKLLVQAALTFSMLLLTLVLVAQPLQKKDFKKPLTKTNTLKPNTTDSTSSIIKPNASLKVTPTNVKDSLIGVDSSIVKIDTLSLDKISKDSLEAPIIYSAEDSGVLDIPGKKFLLYGKASAQYQTMDIGAAIIEIDNQNHVAKAYGVKDTAGLTIGNPMMKDGDMTSESDSMIYDLKSQKGLSKKTITKQGELHIYAERFKKVSENTYYGSKLRFTTCNLDTPHFAFRTKKMKLINGKWAYSGLTYPEVEGIPIPIGIPFGIFPLSQGRHSGFLAPSFSATQSWGYGLEGLGYYKVLNEMLDVTVRTNIYSYGGYTLNISPTYRKRYRYNGGINFAFQHTKNDFKGDPNFYTVNTYRLGWNHSMDGKARPGTTFGANVDIGSSKFNQNVVDPIANITNTLTSSIQFSKSWKQGKYNLQVSGTHSQNNNLHQYNIGLPNLNFNATTFFPFKKEERIGEEKWYEKFGISYSGQLQNQFTFYDTVNYPKDRGKSFIKYLLDTTQWGATHSIPITLALPSMGVFQVSPGISYSERWFGQKIINSWNPVTKKVDTLQVRGFYTQRSASASLGIQTGIFGKFNFKKGNLVAIRHTIRPNLSLSYTPDLTRKFYYDIQVDSTGRKLTLNSINGGVGFAPGPFGGLSFGINQQIEGKVKDKADTTGKGTKKIRLLDNLSINSGYNFFAQGDTCKLSDISIYMGTTLFDKISITASTSLVPYEQNKYGQRTRKYAWSGDKFKLGNINNASLSLSTSLQSKKKDAKKEAETAAHKQNDYYNPEEDYQQQEYIRNHPAEFTDFDVPWTLSLAFTLSISKQPKPDFSGFSTLTTANVNLNGDFSLSPKWKVGSSGYINARNLKIEQVSMFISRDMHCWQLSINVTPVGLRPSFNISISPKSGILRDLKINRTRTFQSIM